MRLRRLFGRGSDEPEPPPEPNDETQAAGDDATADAEYADEEEIEDGARPRDIDRDWTRRAGDVIPGGASTGSKRAEALYGDEAADGPTHFAQAHGCRITTAGGAELVDCTMALGAVAIGYADDVVTASVVEALSAGNVCGLSPSLEVRVAERLTEVIPCAEQVRFLKSGAEAVAAAVRIARAASGRYRVLGCGYFGWLDWCGEGLGIPPAAEADFTRIPFDDIEALEQAADQAGDDLAAVLIEPVIEREPSKEWLQAARDLCDRSGAVLIFDEIKTGFRIRTGGYQEYVGIEPDLATFGKAMANGYPIAAVVGRAAVMEAAKSTWISSTLASETGPLAAVDAVLEWHERAEVCETLWATGARMRDTIEQALAASGLRGVRADGIAPMWLLRFESPELERRFVRMAVRHGALFKRGAYNYAALAHDDEALADIEYAASTTFVALAEAAEE